MRIRQIEAGDIDAVVALWEACALTRPWNDPRQDLARAAESDATVLVGDDRGTLVASVMAGFDGHRGWIYYLAVAPDRQRRGLGRSMFAAAEAWLKDRGAPKVQLMVRQDHSAAKAFYQALGLEVQPVITMGRFFTE
jgi:ribosomal protein S18 acetylase RimI-like enzyme